VFERFHIERFLTQAVEAVRRKESFWRRGARSAAVRGKRWLLLTTFRRLRRGKRREFMALLVMNRRLFKAYLFKEQFEHAWTYGTEKSMHDFLEQWCSLLRWSRLTSLIGVCDMLLRHTGRVVEWACYRLTNTALEVNNNRCARAISPRAHGYRNPNNLLMLYHSYWT
jgi:transposase